VIGYLTVWIDQTAAGPGPDRSWNPVLNLITLVVRLAGLASLRRMRNPRSRRPNIVDIAFRFFPVAKLDPSRPSPGPMRRCQGVATTATVPSCAGIGQLSGRNIQKLLDKNPASVD
jgi:hypothetical protein